MSVPTSDSAADAARRVRALRAELDHPVIDGDGHDIEFLPAVKDELLAIAGDRVLAGFEQVLAGATLARALDVEQRRALGMPRIPWWGLPARNTLDRATAMLPALLAERLEELGIDFAVVYPTYGLTAYHLEQDELRPAACRAFNRVRAESYAKYGDRIAPVAVVPMYSPQEAIDELDHAVGELGMKAVLMGAYAMRPLPGSHASRAARWLDTFGVESPHDYAPVWRRCEELGVAPTFHSTGMGWGSRASTTNYVFNHLGNFAAAGEAICRALFLDGVPQRHPRLRFAFLEGGVGWGCNLYSDLVGHYEKRNREHIHHYDPRELDRARLEELFRRYGDARQLAALDRLDEALHMLSEPDEDRSRLDEFARSGIESVDDIRAIFTDRFFFGCEADDPMNATAFDVARNPGGARLRALFSSDIGHWDVPDMSEVLLEAHELVEHGWITRTDFRDFVFGNAVALWGGANPAFFDGTRVARAAREELAR
ncbi:MAG: amidohydrolase family protein [Myxococcales bacterium]|nr:amidohydrolase family protein [Myxococcales bacterium]